MSPVFWLLLTGLFAVPAYLVWEDRARRRIDKEPEGPPPELVGCVARAVRVKGKWRLKVKGPDGREHVLPARFEDMEDGPTENQELLVIESPSGGAPLVAVPAELPRLEDQCS
ncbi:MAG: hypothetical protein CL940_08400 [Deltaproteobacteria bacterium]|nr:hypothetical protein [Deltaproteobacteria bacterium]